MKARMPDLATFQSIEARTVVERDRAMAKGAQGVVIHETAKERAVDRAAPAGDKKGATAIVVHEADRVIVDRVLGILDVTATAVPAPGTESRTTMTESGPIDELLLLELYFHKRQISFNTWLIKLYF